MRRKYWKVHKDDLHIFENKDGVSQNQISTWRLECSKYNDYIYINEHSFSEYSFMPYDNSSIHFYKSYNFIYAGNINLKRNRKEKLEKLNESRTDVTENL